MINIDGEFEEVPTTIKGPEGEHSIQLYFDNDGQINGDLNCSLEFGCSLCHDAESVWEDISFDSMRTSKRLDLNTVPVKIEYEDEDRTCWFSVINPENSND